MGYVDKADRMIKVYSVSSGLEMEKETLLPFSGAVCSEQFRRVVILWCEIVTSRFSPHACAKYSAA
jgi:hypothetical protein